MIALQSSHHAEPINAAFLEQFKVLFVGRTDAFLQEGRGCVKEPLSVDVIVQHLEGKRRIGAYGLIPNGQAPLAKFLVFDVDGKKLPGNRDEALRRAVAIADALESLGLPTYLEESRSRLGVHVWVFYGSNSVGLELTQQLGRLALTLAALPLETEVFPKGGPGDPYGCTPFAPLHGLLTGEPKGSVFIRHDGQPDDDQVRLLFDVQCVTASQIEAALREAQSLLPQMPIVAEPVAPSAKVDTASTLSGVPEGRRDNELFRLACKLRQADVPRDVAERLLVEAAENCKPPFPRATAVVKVRSAYDRYGAGLSNEGKWSPPAPFHEVDLPPFPSEVLPGWLQDFVEAEALATQTPADLAGGLAVAVCAAACARMAEVTVRDGWIEPLNIYHVTVLPPGTRKSAVFRHVVAPLEDYERRQARLAKPVIEEALGQQKILKGRLKQAQAAASKADPAEQADLEKEAARIARELAEFEVAASPRLIVDDCSPERLATLLRDQGGRMAVMSAEGDVFDLMAGRYSANGDPNFGVYLKGHAGDTLHVDRVNRPAEYVPKPTLTIGLTVQPTVLRGLATKPGFRGRGLLGRILYALPPNPLGARIVDPPGVSNLVRIAYHNNVLKLLSLSPTYDERGNDEPHSLLLSPAALDRLLEFAVRLEPKLAEHGELGGMADWAGKLCGAVVRFAGLFHLANGVAEAEPWAVPIEEQLVEKAITLGGYFLAHARAAFAEMGTDPEVESAKFVLGWIEKKGIELFSKRDVFEGTKSRFKRVKALEPALELLVEHGYIREKEGRDGRRPGRPTSPVYEVNSLIGSQKSQYSQN
jgi:hypothetical protein